ncbi:MAG: ankyrin repeat domain-containing protein [Candidatus Hodarchaeales archaeon]
MNAKDKNGWTVLMWATEGDHTEIIELLKKHGAKKYGLFKSALRTVKNNV